jgi:hypothetical protein
MPGFNDTAFGQAQQMIQDHQAFLQNLTFSHADDPALAQAYNRSQDMGQQFQEMITEHFNHHGANNSSMFMEEQQNAGENNWTPPSNPGGQPGPGTNNPVPQEWNQSTSANQNGNTNQIWQNPNGNTQNGNSQRGNNQNGNTNQTWQNPPQQPGNDQSPSNTQGNRNAGSTSGTNGNNQRGGNGNPGFHGPP